MRFVRYSLYLLIALVIAAGVLVAMPPQTSKYSYVLRSLVSGEDGILEIDFGEYNDILYSRFESYLPIPRDYSGTWAVWDKNFKMRWRAEFDNGQIRRLENTYGSYSDMAFIDGKPFEGSMFPGIRSDWHIIYSIKVDYKGGKLHRALENNINAADCTPFEGRFRSVKSGDLYEFVDGYPVTPEN